ncbi:homoserine O-acetyltransferase MetA [Massiliimalia timonensis]|uniref:homoserine O-acetyltransferase MetA n=1 Tax=Massiliimalia timonensis TaxID=1987501 RepID=UPI000B8B5AD7|nr:homoserine O-succinyltransferase [Massiliimalia timonensis]
MPINIPNSLPAKQTLEQENVYLITDDRAAHQDIRPLRIMILNLMPKKIETETQLLRLLGNTPLQIDIDLLQTATHVSKNTSSEHLLKFYRTFDEVKEERYDGLIITGAPVEMMPFEEVDYWGELEQIFEWSKTHVYSTFHICWGAQAGVYYHYGIEKRILPQKMFGIFPHSLTNANHLLMRGFDEIFQVPHSRHTGIDEKALYGHPELEVLSYSDISGINIAISHDCRRVFVFGHFEYDRRTLANEYFRDIEKGMDNVPFPYHYFPNDDPAMRPPFIWRGHANLLYKNWLNIVYQQTPYDLNDLK